MRVIFMGTPDFSVGTLEALIESKEHEVVLVVTQPDRKKGRGKKVMFSPVKDVAVKYGIPVYQPERIRNAECLEELKKYAADVCVVVAFGQILPESLLTMTPYGAINVHPSLLPAYRGAAPIQWAILDGQEKTGVTTMQMDAGLDTGDMLLKAETPIGEAETGGSLHDRLARMGADLLLETLKGLEEKRLHPVPQGDMTTHYAHMLEKDMGKIDFTRSATEIDRQIRGLSPWPSAYTFFEGKLLKIWEARVVPGSGRPGEVIARDKESFTVAAGKDALKVTFLQLTGKKAMDTGAFLRGNAVEKGLLLGEEA